MVVGFLSSTALGPTNIFSYTPRTIYTLSLHYPQPGVDAPLHSITFFFFFNKQTSLAYLSMTQTRHILAGFITSVMIKQSRIITLGKY